jgi:signal transduction histidine kinase
MVAFGLLVVAALYQLRLRQAAEKLNARMEGRLAERVQIARDLHGTFDPETLRAGGRAGHWGLAGMRERADKVGGKLEFASRPGGGTEIILSVPASAAYQESRILQRWFH